ncbi:MAG: hypothetical protein OXC95_05485 [Dehalococcoidia bacterium]|nr:hypothetical protein [Dehalococcoidia bacterium]
MSTKLDQFAEKVLHCEKTQCPFHQTRPGAYPKFSYGNARAEVMAVFQNPGQPTYQEQSRTIDTVTVAEMRQWANSGVSSWLGTYIDNLSTLEYDTRFFLDSYYMTQAYRCPDPLDADMVKKRREAMRHCSEHLRQEILVVKPKAILCFGREALESVKAILSPSGRIDGIKTLFSAKKIFEWDGTTVFPLVHPNGYWRSPSMSKTEYLSILRWYIDQIESR